LACIPRKNHTTGKRHRYQGRGTSQKSKKRGNSKGTNFEADLGTNFEAVVLLKSIHSAQQVLGTFFEAIHTTFNVVLLLENFLFLLFTDWHDIGGRVQAQKLR